MSNSPLLLTTKTQLSSVGGNNINTTITLLLDVVSYHVRREEGFNWSHPVTKLAIDQVRVVLWSNDHQNAVLDEVLMCWPAAAQQNTFP